MLQHNPKIVVQQPLKEEEKRILISLSLFLPSLPLRTLDHLLSHLPLDTNSRIYVSRYPFSLCYYPKVEVKIVDV